MSRRASVDPDAEKPDPTLNVIPLKSCKWDASLREIGLEATWTLSSAKPKFDVEQLRDGSPDTFWQSDGAVPHEIRMHFPCKVTIEMIALQMDFRADESYTPQQLSLHAGTTCKDALEVHTWTLKEPQGWVLLLLGKCEKSPVRSNYFSLSVLQNHQNGRDTHIRQCRVFAKREEVATGGILPSFTSDELLAYHTLR